MEHLAASKTSLPQRAAAAAAAAAAAVQSSAEDQVPLGKFMY
jgi:hypothetical protein